MILTPNNHGIEGVSVWEEYSGECTSVDFVFAGNFHLEKDNYRQEGISLINNAVLNLG